MFKNSNSLRLSASYKINVAYNLSVYFKASFYLIVKVEHLIIVHGTREDNNLL